ncbi:ATP-binding protein [Bradyrhizobium cenepequi]|uniref:ATP-binding protein n=1 Tax=Bradyrhizobium cenepequi TaxID=2821403 RepID=UPI001CE31F5B|nr:ATP-binding protein [Bradyrhizobium cenepequi]MCA6113047.1 hypothetical protein [Bradyrhizobium cenepequi]
MFHFTLVTAQDLSDFVADPLQDGGKVVALAENSVSRARASTVVAEVVVADNGSGMADEVLWRAVDSNFTTKPDGRGSGLGLGQAQRFVQESGGAIEIKSEVCVGTAVRVMLLPVPRPADGNSVDLSNSIATLGPWGDGSECD